MNLTTRNISARPTLSWPDGRSHPANYRLYFCVCNQNPSPQKLRHFNALMNMKSVQAVRSKNRNLKPTARAYACRQTDRQTDRQQHTVRCHTYCCLQFLSYHVLSSQLCNHISSFVRQFLILSLNVARTEFQNGMGNC